MPAATTTKPPKQNSDRTRRAKRAGLVYVNDFDSGFARRRCGKGFTYLNTQGDTIKSDRTRQRIDALVIPPAWKDVWICPKPNGHIQARGTDDAGRTQYIYHADWHAASSALKYSQMAMLAELLPKIRRKVRQDLSGKKLTRTRVIAAVIRVIDRGRVRVGDEKYLAERGSRGATTLAKQHVQVDGFSVSLDFPGKSGKRQEIEFLDKKVAKVIEQCGDLRGQFLFGYRDEDNRKRPITSSDVNDYLSVITDASVTAKDFRTWWGSVVALASLASAYQHAASSDPEEKLDMGSKTAIKKIIVAAVRAVAEELGNTPAVCRSSYIHPGIIEAAEKSNLESLLSTVDDQSNSITEMTIDETRLAKLLPMLK